MPDNPGATVGGGFEQDPVDFQPGAPSEDATVDDTQGGSEETPPAAEAEAEGDDAAAEDKDDDTLLTEAEIEALAGDPQKLVEGFQKAYTKKTQRLAQQRNFIRLLDEHPEEMLAVLAGKRGMKLVAAAAAEGGGGEGKAKVDDEAFSELETLFGTDLATKMLPAIEKIADRVANKKVEPIQADRAREATEAAREVSRQVLETMDTKYPDWKKYEKPMIQLAAKVQPTSAMTPLEFSEMLYKTVRGEREVADSTGKVITRMQESARRSQPRTLGVADARVVSGPAGKISFEKAFEMAMKGQRRARS